MGIATFIVWQEGWERKDVKLALWIFIVQLILNTLWSIIFFGLHSPGGAFIEIIIQWFAILASIIAFSKISKAAAWLLVPYILWVSFAGHLNYSIWRLNPSQITGPDQGLPPTTNEPSDVEPPVSNFENEHIEKAINRYLLTQKHFSWKNREDSQVFCSVEKLQPDNELFPFYVWSYCAEYVMENGELKIVSGSSVPAKINYPNELSFYDLSKFSYEAPGDGADYTKDVKKIFPQDLQDKVFKFDPTNISKRNEKKALDNILGWEEIKKAVLNCEVEQAFQAHSLEVSIQIKNGEKIIAT